MNILNTTQTNAISGGGLGLTLVGTGTALNMAIGYGQGANLMNSTTTSEGKHSLLLPAMLVANSITLTGCALIYISGYQAKKTFIKDSLFG